MGWNVRVFGELAIVFVRTDADAIYIPGRPGGSGFKSDPSSTAQSRDSAENANRSKHAHELHALGFNKEIFCGRSIDSSVIRLHPIAAPWLLNVTRNDLEL